MGGTRFPKSVLLTRCVIFQLKFQVHNNGDLVCSFFKSGLAEQKIPPRNLKRYNIIPNTEPKVHLHPFASLTPNNEGTHTQHAHFKYNKKCEGWISTEDLCK